MTDRKHTERQTTDRRQQQIIAAMLDLLATTPVERITTRQIAKAVGLTQPALFRHFRSRDEVILALLARTRSDLAGLAHDVLTSPLPVPERVARLVQGLFAHVESHPGLPRLLFHDVAQGEPSTTRLQVEALVAMQRTLVAELVRIGQREGTLPAEIDAEGAGRLLVALVQGVLMQWQMLGRGEPLGEQAMALAAFWRAAVLAGQPRQVDRAQAQLPVLAVLSALDVRPLLASGVDPFAAVLDAVGRMPAGGVLKLTAPFRPTPLLAVLAGRGLHVTDAQVTPGRWDIEVRAADAPDPMDLRDLPAPEPLECVLTLTSALAPGASLLFRVPRVPSLLLPHLASRGLEHAVHTEPDGSALLHVRKSP